MSIFILLALINGLFIGLSRSINGQLSLNKGPFNASFYNHLVGFLLLSMIMIGLNLESTTVAVGWESETWYLYLGGLIGALYVALNSFVLNQLGTTKTALLVISGQMMAGVLLDFIFKQASSHLLPYLMQIIGVIFILFGIVLSQKRQQKAENIPVPKLKHSHTLTK